MSATSSSFPQVYEDLGISTNRLGCVMIDVEPITVSDIIAEEDLRVKEDDPDWLKGYIAEKTPHVTLLYGLMRSGQELRKHVDAVLDGVMPRLATVTIDKVDFFYSSDPGEDYITIIALVTPTADLIDANARLRLLPHIDTFPTYKPHITLAYVKNGSRWQEYVAELNGRLAGKQIPVTELNYGD